tara:strand:- start:64 stop:438 length:375 start_codon:yes stop_codon:yes gene_type:complete
MQGNTGDEGARVRMLNRLSELGIKFAGGGRAFAKAFKEGSVEFGRAVAAQVLKIQGFKDIRSAAVATAALGVIGAGTAGGVAITEALRPRKPEKEKFTTTKVTTTKTIGQLVEDETKKNTKKGK